MYAIRYPRPETIEKTLTEDCEDKTGQCGVGTGPVVISLHGAMGGYDQSLILAQTIGGAGYRYLCVSRPGYLGTPLASGRSLGQQGDLIAALLELVPFKIHAKMYESRIRNATLLAVDGGEHVAIFTHRNFVRTNVSAFMHRTFQPGRLGSNGWTS